MTADRLRELLRQRVEDVTTVDLTGDAWADAQRIRRRRTTGVIAAVVAVVALVGGAAVVATSGSGPSSEPPPPAEQQQSPGRPVDRGTVYRGAQVWWAPTVEQEAALPRLEGTPLPATIGLSEGQPAVPQGVHVVGAFQVWEEDLASDSVVVLADDGSSYSLDVGHLEPVTDDGGNSFPPLGATSVSPDGRYAFFRQRASLEVYAFEDGTWTTIATDPWAAEFAGWDASGLIAVPNLDNPRRGWMLYSPGGEALGTSASSGAPLAELPPTWAEDEPYGPVRAGEGGTAVAAWLAGPLARPGGAEQQPVESVVVTRDDEIAVLAMPAGRAGTRWNQCCAAVGWHDGAVLFLSRHEDARILAWQPETAEVFRVSDIRGWRPGEESYVASFADLDLDRG